jgi:isopentenyl-diphosphate delta-isomerase
MENVVLVDEYDTEVGVMEKMEAHRLGQLHRAFSVILLNDKNEMLLQKRAASKYHSAGLWSNTCCSHPRPGEDTASAAQRRLMEEMGLSCQLKKSFSFVYKINMGNGLIEHEYDHVYTGFFSGTPLINPDEVSDWAYINQEMISLDMRVNPERYTYWFKVLFDKLSVLSIDTLPHYVHGGVNR